MICPKCGNEVDISSGMKFCTKCGERLVQEEEYIKSPVLPERSQNSGSSEEGQMSTSSFGEASSSASADNLPLTAVNNTTSTAANSAQTAVKSTQPVSGNSTSVKKDRSIQIGLGVVAALLVVLIVILIVKKPAGNTATAVSEENQSNVVAETTAENSDATETEDTNESPENYDQQEATASDETVAAKAVDETAIHRYELIVDDVTWTQAYNECLNRGGHLARINNDDEFRVIVNQIERENKRNIKFWIGGSRESTYEYRWVYNDADTGPYPIVYGDERLDKDPYYAGFWLENEPSYYDNNYDSVETKMNLIYVKKYEKWVWNDVPDDVLAIAPGYAGQIGYICEYD